MPGRRVNDAAAFDRAVRELEESGEEIVPAEIVNRLLAGEAPVRVWREYRGLTQAALAAHAGVSQSYVAMPERGDRRGTTEKLTRLARALDVDLEDLAPQGPEATQTED